MAYANAHFAVWDVTADQTYWDNGQYVTDHLLSLDVDDDGEVQLAEVRNVLMRASVTPIDDSALQAWMADADEDGGGALDFGEFVRVSSKGNVTF